MTLSGYLLLQAKESLRNDPRYEDMPREKRERLFEEHAASRKAQREREEKEQRKKKAEEVRAVFDFVL